VIRGEQTNLRAVERSDARFVCDLLNEASVQAGWGTSGVPVSIHAVEQQIEDWIERERLRGRPHALIIESLEREPIGLFIVALSDRINQSMATVSVAIQTQSQGHGYGRDALTALIDALFDEWRIHRIQMTCEADNEPAAHLYESLGFHHEATRVEATYTGGSFRDQRVYGLLATDPRPGEPA
jgi:diamine N-acetyltransferase